MHTQDVADVIGTLRATPVLVGHSFGGLIMQRYLAEAAQQNQRSYPLPPANVFLCSSPPDKIDVMRYMRNAPMLSIKVRALRCQDITTTLHCGCKQCACCGWRLALLNHWRSCSAMET